jgi:hypothetical protein
VPSDMSHDLIPNLTIVYRGQLDPEFSRIDFLVEAACRAAQKASFVYLAPEGAATEARLNEFVARFPSLGSAHYVLAEKGRARSARAELEAILGPSNEGAVVTIGFSTARFMPQRHCLAWCVNGIPEERLLHGASFRQRALVAGAWAAASARLRPSIAVTVSEPMSKLVKTRSRVPCVAVPNAVDRSIYHSDAQREPIFLTYQGAGSPW